ncbi:MAG: electron transfer flavoprotein [Candidatus Nitrosothermus koennekii]|nr:MAG: electron transfer flavoprotein [Candidatus Nitrosothermus koennekii]
MEKYEVTIVGGGSAGLAALMELSKLGIQAVLLESGNPVGSKSVTGGILYSKEYPNAKVYNVDDVYQNFEEAPVERLIDGYYLNAVSRNKVFTIDLTEAHHYRTKFAYSVLMARLNRWFAEEAEEEAIKEGGGIVSGVHVRDVRWIDGKTIIETDELEEFETNAIIAADGVNSELAWLTNARDKFEPEALYQGVKCVVRLPEDIIDERFDVSNNKGVAHLFAGDISKGHNGGGFLYTNKDTLSLGLVYHLDSLIKNPIEPYNLLDNFLKIPIISNLIADEVPVPKELPKDIPKEEELRIRFTLASLLKEWEEVRYTYYSKTARKRAIENKVYANEEEIENKLNDIRNKLKEYVNFITNYVELEYSTKLVPDGKRAMMDKPYKNNVLFIGDAAGKGVFIGTRIEGINIGIDDAARAARAIARAKEKNNFSEDYLGGYYQQLIKESPYTYDIKNIDFEYMRIFVRACSGIPTDSFNIFLRLAFHLLSRASFQGLAERVARMLDQKTLLRIIESNDAYVKLPIEIAEKIGRVVNANYIIKPRSIDERIAALDIEEDPEPHIKIKEQNRFVRSMVHLCPTKCYILEKMDSKELVILQHEGCIECGTCSKETEWRHTRGEKGVRYEYG